jgi:hypothetical protein
VAQDLVEAHWWVNLAASRSSGEQQANYSEALDDIAAQMTPAQVARRQERIQEWTGEFERRSRR